MHNTCAQETSYRQSVNVGVGVRRGAEEKGGVLRGGGCLRRGDRGLLDEGTD